MGKANRLSYMVLTDLLDRSRKVKIHLIVAAQDSTKENIAIKMTNLGAAIAFKCTNRYASQAIIDAPDAANLSGKGSMYFKSDQCEGIKRLQGSFMEPEEIMDMLDKMEFDYGDIKGEYKEVIFDSQLFPELNNIKPETDSSEPENEDEKILGQIVRWTLDKENISNKQIKDHFGMGYDRANKFLKILEDFGIITEQRKGAKLPRKIISDKAKDFLIEHGYTDTKSILNEKLSTSDMPDEMNLNQNVEAITDIKEIAEYQQNDTIKVPPNTEIK